MPKGSSYEREVAKTLSLWWSNGKRDDLCWRTSNSGGRATVRGRKGKQTVGHAGDLGATDVEMIPFFKLVTVEAKRGYNKTTSLHNLFDPPSRESGKAKTSNYTAFLRQTRRAAKRANTPYWMMIHRPDRKNAVVFMPAKLFDDLTVGRGIPPPWGTFILGKKGTPILFITLDKLLSILTRKDFKRLYASVRNSS